MSEIDRMALMCYNVRMPLNCIEVVRYILAHLKEGDGMSYLRKANELDLKKLGLSRIAYRIVKDTKPEDLVRMARERRLSELFTDEEGLPLYLCHWEKLHFARLEIERKLVKAGFIESNSDYAY